MIERIRGWLAGRRADRAEREGRALEDAKRGDDEARAQGPGTHDVAEDRLQHPAQHAPPG